jgi:competence ComEA-like helix-hairpin-helix protein
MQFFKDYFTIPKSNKIELIIIVVVILLISISNIFIPQLIVRSKTDFSEYEKAIKSLTNEKNSNSYKFIDSTNSTDYESENFKLFRFNPNTATYQQFIDLGIKPYIAQRIVKYRNNGGKFKKKEDLKKIFGFDLDLYNKLESFINIDDEADDVISKEKNEVKPIVLDINNCAKEELILLKGIGEKRAELIIKYRNLLGGFIYKEQLMEVFGIDSSVYKQFKENVKVDAETKVRYISLNLSEKNDLGYHPYIGFELATKIIEYRNKNGPFKSLDELYQKKIIADRKVYERILPYLSLWE